MGGGRVELVYLELNMCDQRSRGLVERLRVSMIGPLRSSEVHDAAKLGVDA